jgi:hypothetical protein
MDNGFHILSAAQDIKRCRAACSTSGASSLQELLKVSATSQRSEACSVHTWQQHTGTGTYSSNGLSKIMLWLNLVI